jgi:Mg2+-importing ATPase
LLYDSSQFAIPLDAVDESEVITPHTLSIREIKRFMWSYGLLSSIFDFVTFGTLLLIFHTDQSVFQAGWFLESILTQVFVVYIIRTKLIPFKQSWPSPALIASTLLVVLVSFVVVISPIRFIFQFGGLSVIQILSLVMVVAVYLLFAQLIKKKFYGSGSQSRLVKSS